MGNAERARALVERAVATLGEIASVAVVGASADPEKYGHELVEVLAGEGKRVLPVNPKRSEILGLTCYPSLDALPERPDAVVVALAPGVTERVVERAAAVAGRVVWLPPGCYTEAAVERARAAGAEVLAGVCPVMAARAARGRGGP